MFSYSRVSCFFLFLASCGVLIIPLPQKKRWIDEEPLVGDGSHADGAE